MTSLFQLWLHWRGVCDPGRWAALRHHNINSQTMSPKQKLALVILWVGMAVAIAIGYFGGNQPISYSTIAIIGILVTFLICTDTKKD